MREKSMNNGPYPGNIASNPPDATHSFNPRQVKDDPTSQQLGAARGARIDTFN